MPESIQGEYPGIEANKISDSKWKILIPLNGREAFWSSYGQLFEIPQGRQLPAWEVQYDHKILHHYTSVQKSAKK